MVYQTTFLPIFAHLCIDGYRSWFLPVAKITFCICMCVILLATFCQILCIAQSIGGTRRFLPVSHRYNSFLTHLGTCPGPLFNVPGSFLRFFTRQFACTERSWRTCECPIHRQTIFVNSIFLRKTHTQPLISAYDISWKSSFFIWGVQLVDYPILVSSTAWKIPLSFSRGRRPVM